MGVSEQTLGDRELLWLNLKLIITLLDSYL